MFSAVEEEMERRHSAILAAGLPHSGSSSDHLRKWGGAHKIQAKRPPWRPVLTIEISNCSISQAHKQVGSVSDYPVDAQTDQALSCGK